MQRVTNVPLSLDTTNFAAMEAGLKVCTQPAMLNSASADPDRLDSVMQLAARYGAKVIALTMGVDGIRPPPRRAASPWRRSCRPRRPPVPVADVFLDPLVLAMNCNQDVAMETVEAVRMFKMMADPPPTTVIGLSNISNGALPEVRPLINRVMMVMAMGAGLDSAIADPLDTVQNEWIRIAEQRDESTPMSKLIVALYDAVAAMDKLDQSLVDMGDQEQVELWKTYRMLTNETLYADSYLQL